MQSQMQISPMMNRYDWTIWCSCYSQPSDINTRQNEYSSQLVTVTVPPNFSPGQPLQIALQDGRVVNIQVPPGTAPGSVLQVDVGASFSPPTPQMPPVGSLSIKSTIDEVGAKRYLSSNKWPAGLQNAFLASCHRFPVHFFILDNSGSMAAQDVHRLLNSSDPRRARCSPLLISTKTCNF